jgi:hypothetical protein
MADTIWDRLSTKTVDQLFVQELMTGFELAPRAADGILEVAKTVLVPNSSGLRPGQIKLIATAASARHGRPMTDLDKCEVVVTLDGGPEDVAVWHAHGAAALRQVRLLRLTDEAFEQDALFTEEDLAWILGAAVRTIRRDIRDLRQQGYAVRTRGYQLSIGRGQTHKVLIVEHYLKRQSFSEIAHRTKHSLAAIQRYVQTFGRVVYLHRRQTSRAEIAFLVGVGEKTVQQYLDLYAGYDRPEHQERLNEIIAPPTGQPFLAMGKKGVLR